jgi:archaellum component FlaG (FlaF/FlaG flagellin family)
MNSKLLTPTIALLLIATTITLATAGLLSPHQTSPTNGTITHLTNIEVYSDITSTIKCNNIDWGSIYPQSNDSKTIYIKNTGNTTENLSLETSDWNPTEATSIITLSWNREGASIAPGQVIEATLTLSTGADNGKIDDFNFNIVIKNAE